MQSIASLVGGFQIDLLLAHEEDFSVETILIRADSIVTIPIRTEMIVTCAAFLRIGGVCDALELTSVFNWLQSLNLLLQYSAWECSQDVLGWCSSLRRQNGGNKFDLQRPFARLICQCSPLEWQLFIVAFDQSFGNQ